MITLVFVFSHNQKWNIKFINFFILFCFVFFLVWENIPIWWVQYILYTWIFCFLSVLSSKYKEVSLSWYCHNRSSPKLSFVLIRTSSVQLKFIMPGLYTLIIEGLLLVCIYLVFNLKKLMLFGSIKQELKKCNCPTDPNLSRDHNFHLFISLD